MHMKEVEAGQVMVSADVMRPQLAWRVSLCVQHALTTTYHYSPGAGRTEDGGRNRKGSIEQWCEEAPSEGESQTPSTA